MKKKLSGFLLLVAVGLLIVGCGNKTNSTGDATGESKLVIGASSTPHAEILEHVQPLMEEKGVKLKIVQFNDYILPNKALEEHEIDANYFQHIPYFNLQVANNGYDFANAGNIHVEPMGLYSKTITDINELPDGATILTSNSESDWGRILTILQEAGVLTLKDGVDPTTATFDDIAKNPKNLKFKHDLDAEILPIAYENNEADLVAINANFAVGVGLDPQEDSILVESDNSPYANMVAVRSEDVNNPNIQTLIEVLHEPEVQQWMIENFQGVVQPVSAK